MRLFIFGATGMLGKNLVEHLGKTHRVTPVTRSEVDITDMTSVRNFFKNQSDIDWVINAAAYTAVDQSEIEQNLSHKVNAIGPQNLAEACRQQSIPMVHFSTDYVFDGTKPSPYEETDPVQPVNAYGAAKLAGEIAIQAIHSEVYICRIQWLYGEHGQHFVKTISQLAQTKEALSIVSDQWGSPTWTQHVSEAISAMITHRPEWGVYHLGNTGYTNWHEFATYFLSKQNSSCTLIPCGSKDFPTPAKRPLNSRLSTEKFQALGIYRFPTWQEAIDESLPLLL